MEFDDLAVLTLPSDPVLPREGNEDALITV
jgi:hypothetical protein